VIRITPAKREDAIWLSSRLRPDDSREIITSTGRAPEEIVPLSFDISDECFTVRSQHSDEPIAIYGVVDDYTDARMGVVWLLATPRMSSISRSFLRKAPELLDYLAGHYTRGLHNLVDARNTLHLRWLQKTGFRLGDCIQRNGFKFVHAVRLNRGVKP
jgi:hypothetical protein